MMDDNKIREIEEFEQEIGIDLTILFKALNNGFYHKGYDFGSPCVLYVDKDHVCLRVHPYFCICNLYEYDDYEICSDFELRDYGKTWALTKEELQ